MLTMVKSRATRPPLKSVAAGAALISFSIVLVFGLIFGIVSTASNNSYLEAKIPTAVVGISQTSACDIDDMICRDRNETLKLQ